MALKIYDGTYEKLLPLKVSGDARPLGSNLQCYWSFYSFSIQSVTSCDCATGAHEKYLTSVASDMSPKSNKVWAIVMISAIISNSMNSDVVMTM
jgi:hypothetical protein